MLTCKLPEAGTSQFQCLRFTENHRIEKCPQCGVAYVCRSSFAASPPGGPRRRTGSVFRGSGGPGALAPLVSGVPSDFSSTAAALSEAGRQRSRSIGRSFATAEGRISAADVLRRESVSVPFHVLLDWLPCPVFWFPSAIMFGL